MRLLRLIIVLSIVLISLVSANLPAAERQEYTTLKFWRWSKPPSGTRRALKSRYPRGFSGAYGLSCAPVSPDSLGQVVKDAGLFPKSLRQQPRLWKSRSRQQAAQSSGCRFRMAIPESGRDRGQRGCQVGHDGAGQQVQCGQALAALWGEYELPCPAQHLLAGCGDLFDRPAVSEQPAQRSAG